DCKKKELARNRVRASSEIFISTSLSSDDNNGGGGNSGARRTHSKADNSHSTDTVCSIYTDNSHSHIRCNSHTADNQPRFRLTPGHQNVARGRKPIHLPSMPLREVSS